MARSWAVDSYPHSRLSFSFNGIRSQPQSGMWVSSDSSHGLGLPIGGAEGWLRSSKAKHLGTLAEDKCFPEPSVWLEKDQ